MKKLLSILGALGIISSSATTVIACGGKGRDSVENEDQLIENYRLSPNEKNAYYATSDMAKVFIQGKSENVGNNRTDNFVGAGSGWTGYNTNKAESVQMLTRMANVNTSLGTTGFQAREAQHVQMWKNVYSDAFLSTGKFSSTKATGERFISQDKLATSIVDSKNKIVDSAKESVNGSLNYLLADNTNSFINKGSMEKGDSASLRTNETANAEEVQSITKMTSANIAAANAADSGKSIASLFVDAGPEKEPLFISWLSRIFPVTLTDYTPDIDNSNSSFGLMHDGFFGHGGNSMVDRYLKTTTNNGSTVGLFSEIYEKTWSYLVDQFKDSDQKDNEIVKYLLGNNYASAASGDNGHILIDNVYETKTDIDSKTAIGVKSTATDEAFKVNGYVWDEKDTSEGGAVKTVQDWFADEDDENNTKNWDAVKGDVYRDTAWFSASDDTGLYGKLINAIGKLKFHKKWNNHDGYADEYLTGANNMGSWDEEVPNGLDKDIEEILKLTAEIQHVTNTYFAGDIADGAYKAVYDVMQPLLGVSTIKNYGFNITEANFKDYYNLMLEFLDSYLGWNKTLNTSASASDLDSTLSDAFTLETPDALRAATSTMKENPNADGSNDEEWREWFADYQAPYRNAVSNALGAMVDDNGNYTGETKGLYAKFQEIASKYGDTLFDASAGKESVNYINDLYDNNIMDPEKWLPSNINVRYAADNSTISSISYTLEYKGYGNDDVSQFKNEYQSLSQFDVLKKLNSFKDGEDTEIAFRKKWNGAGTNASLSNVDHFYTVTFVNEDGRLVLNDLSNEYAMVDGKKVEFKL